MQSQLVDEIKASEILNVRVSALRDWRYQRKHIPFIKLGATVRYSIDALEKFLESQTIQVNSPVKGESR